MKTYIKLLTVLFLYISLSSFAQKSQDSLASVLFQKATLNYDRGDLHVADSLYSRLLEIIPNIRALYNQGMIRYQLNNICGSCSCFKKGSEMGDREALKMYNKFCVIEDSVSFYSKSKEYQYYGMQWITVCKTQKVRYYKHNLTTGIVTGYEIIGKNQQYGNQPLNKNVFPDFSSMNATDYKQYDEFLFNQIEEKPEFPGGEFALQNYLAKTIHYPVEAREIAVSGVVYLQFTITSEGEIKDIVTINKPGYGLEEEAIRIAQLMPTWKPCKVRGEAINVRFVLSIRFTLSD